MVNATPYWTRPAYDPATVQQIVAWAVPALQEFGIEAIAASGNSGLAVAGAIGYAAKLPVFAARKGDDHHQRRDPANGVAPNGPVTRWAFVDDLIESGRTLNRTRGAIRDAGLTTTPIPSLILLYSMSVREAYEIDGVQVPIISYPGA